MANNNPRQTVDDEWEYQDGGEWEDYTPTPAITQFEQERKPQYDVQGGTLERSVHGVGRGLRNVFGGAYQTIRHPIDTAKGIYNESAEQFRLAGEEPSTIGKAARYGAAIPMLGSLGRVLGERAAEGDYAGAISEGLTSAVTPSLLKGAVRAIPAARSGIARKMYEPTGKLKPSVEFGSKIVGAGVGEMSGVPYGGLAGWLGGPSAAKVMFPNPNPPGWFGRISTRMPKEPATTPFPGATSEVSSGVTVVPEPRPLFTGENPNYAASIPRPDLLEQALRRKPGAGRQLQQLGEPIIYQPRPTLGRK